MRANNADQPFRYDDCAGEVFEQKTLRRNSQVDDEVVLFWLWPEGGWLSMKLTRNREGLLLNK